MDNNNSNLNTESWEFSLEAILAEYSAQPEPEAVQRPEEIRSREIVMEALSERIAASVEKSEAGPQEIPPHRAKRSLFRRGHTETVSQTEPDTPAEDVTEAESISAPEPDPEPAIDVPVLVPENVPQPDIDPDPVSEDLPITAPEPEEDPVPRHLPPAPKAHPPKGAAIFNIADIIAEVHAAEAAGRDTAEIPVQLPIEGIEGFSSIDTAEDGPEASADISAITELPLTDPDVTAESVAEAEPSESTEEAETAQNDMPGTEGIPEEFTEADEISDDIETSCVSDAEKPLSENTASAETKGPEKRRLSVLTSLMAALLIRRQQKHERAKAMAAAEAETRADADETPEVSPKAASKYYLNSATPYKMRFSVAVLLCLVLLYISWGLPLLGGMKDIRLCAGMCMVLELSVMLLGLDIFTQGMMSLFRGRPGLASLASVSCIFSVLDALIILLGGPQRGLPYCGVSAVSLCAALLGERLLCMGMARSFHTAAAAKSPTVITSEEGVLKEGSVLLKSEHSIRGFVNRAQETDAVELSYSAIAPILLVAAPVLAFIATVCRKQAGDFFHCLSALTAVSASFSAFLSFTMPFSAAAKRLSSVGASIAGWAGCVDFGESRRIVVTDKDVFPEGNVLIDTIRILEGVYTDKVISYAGSVVAFSGSGLSSAFTELMRRNGCSLHPVENFACHRGGGLTAIVRGEQVFVGNSSFMNLMGIRLPQSQMSQTSVFVAISGELVGVFSIRYTPTASVQDALVNLMRGRGADPLFAIRDFNVTPYLIKQRFRMPTEGFEFPSFPERYRISGIAPDENSSPAAVLARKGLAPYVEAAQTGRDLYRGSRVCLLLSLICSVLGMLLMFFLCAAGAYDSASVGNILLFMLLWLVPVAAVTLGLRR